MRPRSAALPMLLLILFPLALVLAAAQKPPAPTPPPAAAPGQQPGQVTLVLPANGQQPRITIASPASRGQLGGDGAAAARELEETVRRDLDASGYFEIQGPDVLSGLHLTGDVQKDLAAYKSTGNEVILLGEVKNEEARLVFDGRVLDAASGQAALAKRYRGPYSVSRRMAHTFADEVVRTLVGKPGIALSAIAYTSDRSGAKEIWVMDYDGANPRRITGHHSTSMSPAWSPDGTLLA